MAAINLATKPIVTPKTKPEVVKPKAKQPKVMGP
jgi:hypothetical protein